MQTTLQTEDLNSLARDYFVSWEHLPYRSLYDNYSNAALAYLSQFPEIERGSYSPSGSLFLYTEPDMLVGVRQLFSESSNFGVHCARLEPAVFKHPDPYGICEIEPAARFLRSVISTLEGPDHLSAIADSSDIFTQHVLQTSGFRLADTIAGYHIPLAKLPAFESDPAIRTARPDDVPRLSAIATACFSQCHLNINRFNAEPAFDNDVAGRTYGNWFTRAVLERDADLVLVFDDGNLAGFLTLRLPPERETKYGVSIGRFVLAAVDPEHHGKGIYRRLIKTGLKWMQDRDVRFAEGKMHLSNHGPINVWQSFQARLALTYHTFHWTKNLIAGLNRLEAALATDLGT
jgi:ribosomal protein S18 acetylase RimI-like enzyme